MKATQEPIVSIDASGKPLGRLASEVAARLQGKDNPAFSRNVLAAPRIRIINLRQVKFTGRKLAKKRFYRHTGYIGHLKTETLSALWKKNPAEVLKRTVAGMLPKNTLRQRMLKRLEIEL